MDLTIVKDRDKLKARREPYWQRLGNGRHLGYRAAAADGPGSWIAKRYNPDTRKRDIKSLGDFGALPAKDRFQAAKKAAEEWLSHLDGGGINAELTVSEACKRYAEKKGATDEFKTDAEGRFRRCVNDDPIASLQVAKLRKVHLVDWRDRLSTKPAQVTRSKRGLKVTRERSASSINRDMTTFRAALNMAYDDGYVLTNAAWRKALEPIKNAARRRNDYLDRDQRRSLLAALPEDLRTFAHGLCLLPLRPGTLAALRAGDFDPAQKLLTIGKDKANQDRKIPLPDVTVDLLKKQRKGKLPAAPLFARADGSAWNKDAWKKPIKAAAKQAALPETVTAYTLRHSTITDLVKGKLDLMTVAQLSGTSVAMIEAHYAHLTRDHAAQALATLAL